MAAYTGIAGNGQAANVTNVITDINVSIAITGGAAAVYFYQFVLRNVTGTVILWQAITLTGDVGAVSGTLQWTGEIDASSSWGFDSVLGNVIDGSCFYNIEVQGHWI